MSDAGSPPPFPAPGPDAPGGALPPAGWFADPDGVGLRWWDGTAWTEEQAHQGGMACLVCRCTEFDRTSYMLNTQGMTLLGFDAFNRQANCFVCRRCGFIHWFAPAPPVAR